MDQNRYAAGDVIDSRYRVLNRVGGGSQAEVFKCEHVHIPRPVMLKIAWNAEGKMHDGVIKEALILGRISHEGIPRVLDAGRDRQGCGYVVTEWIEGVNLASTISALVGAASASVSLVRSIAVALDALHSAGWLHLDVKPTNIVIPIASQQLLYDRARLIDFGLATELLSDKSNGVRKARGGRLTGTTFYMAPEQLAGRRRTIESDLYGLGAVLFELFYGYPPFVPDRKVVRYSLNHLGGRVEFSTIAARLTQRATRPESPEIRDDIWRLLDWLLQTDPADRPGSASVVAVELCAIYNRLMADAPTACRAPAISLGEEVALKSAVRSHVVSD